MFQLAEKELIYWISQIVISNKEKMGIRKLPLAFTEQGVAMLSSVLKSETAIAVNIQIIRIFSRMQEVLLNHNDLLLKLDQLERKFTRQDSRLRKHDEEIQIVFKALKELLDPSRPPHKSIGFNYNKGEKNIG